MRPYWAPRVRVFVHSTLSQARSFWQHDRSSAVCHAVTVADAHHAKAVVRFASGRKPVLETSPGLWSLPCASATLHNSGEVYRTIRAYSHTGVCTQMQQVLPGLRNVRRPKPLARRLHGLPTPSSRSSPWEPKPATGMPCSPLQPTCIRDIAVRHKMP